MKTVLTICLILGLNSCTDTSKSETVGKIPELKSDDSKNSTVFVPTMESQLDSGKNLVYCPTLLYAWDEIKNQLGEIKLNPAINSKMLIELNASQSFKNALKPNEFSSAVKIDTQRISVTTTFNTELTFRPLLEKLKYPIYFNDTPVNGFGMNKYDPDITKKVKILYFEDNNNFIFKIEPEQKDNEIVFIMGSAFNKAKSFSELNSIAQNKIAVGQSEIESGTNLWKYSFNYKESFAIPELAFNIEKEFPELIGQVFSNEKLVYFIESAKQRNALVLNNKGAIIESEAMLDVKSLKEFEENITKHLTLNKTFFVLFKHKSETNPYFCMKIENDAYMTKSKNNQTH